MRVDSLGRGSRSGLVVSTPTPARPGEDIRFELVGDGGTNVAHGLARVVAVESGAMSLQLLALGIDAALAAQLPGTGPRPPTQDRAPLTA